MYVSTLRATPRVTSPIPLPWSRTSATRPRTYTVEKDKLTLVSIEKKQNKNYGLTKQK